MISKIPNDPHFAIVTEVSVTIPGDERSRTHPGHGYPESTETYIKYESFTDRAKWEERIAHYTTGYGRKEFRAFCVNPVKVSIKLDLSGMSLDEHGRAVIRDEDGKIIGVQG